MHCKCQMKTLDFIKHCSSPWNHNVFVLEAYHISYIDNIINRHHDVAKMEKHKKHQETYDSTEHKTSRSHLGEAVSYGIYMYLLYFLLVHSISGGGLMQSGAYVSYMRLIL